jgi:mono/diheme cytochrome c family protein
MRRTLHVGIVAGLMAAMWLVHGSAQAPAPTVTPTFTRDVAPILYGNCVTCHRAGESAPMSLISYQEVRPWARAIRDKVSSGAMPPWHAESLPGTFENERRLTSPERDLINRWVEAGAPEGDALSLPSPPRFEDGWGIGRPDAIFEMAEDYPVPARGTIEYENFYIPTNFTTTQWLKAIEVRPGNRPLVHHVLVYYQAPASGPAGPPVLGLNPEHNRLPRREPGLRPTQRPVGPSRLIATFAPGTDPQVFRDGTALRLEAGGVLQLQLHYSTNGTAGTDRTKVGMVLAKAAPAQEIRATAFLNATLSIPPGATEHRVDTELGFQQDAVLWGLFPHTHVRGKRWSYTLALPDGSERVILSVPRYDFNWQTFYMFKQPIAAPKGSRLVSSAWYDNSEANRFNPDPKVTVKWGDQTWEEMQYSGLLYSAGSTVAATGAEPSGLLAGRRSPGRTVR